MILKTNHYTEPTIVTSDDLSKRSYITFYFNDERIREYNGKSICQRISPNKAKSLAERTQLLEKLKYEFHKALDANKYPTIEVKIDTTNITPSIASATILEPSTIQLLFIAIRDKLKADLSRTYKRDLKSIYRDFKKYMSQDELTGPIASIPTTKIERFLSQFGSSGTYYMNKRRNLGVLFSSAGRLIDKPLKSVKESQRRKAKSKLHEKYDKEQLVPILKFLKANYHNLYICCLLTYGSWLRPHEEIRLLTAGDFKNDLSEVHLSGDENKGGKVRVVYVPDYIRKELAPRLANMARNTNIFSLREEPFNYSYFNTQWSRAYAKMFTLGLIYEDQTIYSFRHTAAVDLYRKTKDVYLLQKLLGHSTIVVTLKYLRNLGELNTDELKQAAPLLELI